MRLFVSLFALILSLNVFAGSGVDSLKIVLDTPEVEKLDNDMREKGFILSKIEDVYAQKGAFPRCPCTSLSVTFTKVSADKAENKIYSVSTQGFGTNLKVSISPAKK